jgi:hypothetical protein
MLGLEIEDFLCIRELYEAIEREEDRPYAYYTKVQRHIRIDTIFKG